MPAAAQVHTAQKHVCMAAAQAVSCACTAAAAGVCVQHGGYFLFSLAGGVERRMWGDLPQRSTAVTDGACASIRQRSCPRALLADRCTALLHSVTSSGQPGCCADQGGGVHATRRMPRGHRRPTKGQACPHLLAFSHPLPPPLSHSLLNLSELDGQRGTAQHQHAPGLCCGGVGPPPVARSPPPRAPTACCQ